MAFDWERIANSKQEMRRKLAALPVAEKLRMVEAMRDRDALIRASKPSASEIPLTEPNLSTGSGPAKSE